MNLKNLPNTPGVYIFKNGQDKIIYIGKANNLKNRVSSYFQKSSLYPKTAAMVSQIADLSFIEVISEIEALILEANLIKKYKPYFNVRLKDDKDYLYVKITKEEFPKILLARKKDLKDAYKYFGPFPEGTQVRKIIKTLRKVFPYSTCTPNAKRACFYYHIGQCLGVCINKVTPIEYRRMIRRFISFMSGNKDRVIVSLAREMKRQSYLQNYEKALTLKKQIGMIGYITQPIGKVESYIENPNLIEEIRENQLLDLAKDLGLKSKIDRIECYDISHFMGFYTAGSMVVLSKGAPDKAEYRRFRIKDVVGIDDYASMKEVLRRRFRNDWQTPDLVVIDGGKGQLSAALEVFSELGVTHPVIGLAKREEQVYLPGEKEPLTLKRTDKSLQIIQLIRDEAHRFALKYHRKMRSSDFLTK